MICAHIFCIFFSVRFSFIIFETLFISMEKAKRFDSFHFEFGTHRIPDFLIEICIYIKFRRGRCVCVCVSRCNCLDGYASEREEVAFTPLNPLSCQYGNTKTALRC